MISSGIQRASSWLRRQTRNETRSVPIKALLLDLDDTLLINDWQVFSSRYYELLVEHVEAICPRERFMSALSSGTRAMFANDGTRGSNKDVFFEVFLPLVGDSGPELVDVLDRFYEKPFDSLGQWTDRDPAAALLLETAQRHDLQIAVATQPIFPLAAILARLRWAGVAAESYEYDYIACYEKMSACKPRGHYFRTICNHLGRAPEECLMVGDSIDADMPASRHGLRTFWMARRPPAGRMHVKSNAQGLLPDLIHLIESGEIHDL